MKGPKHSRQQSDSAATSRRREAQARNTLAQAQAYQQQQRMPTNTTTAAYYSMPSAEQDVYDAYHASAGVLPQQQQQQQYQQYQQQVDQQQNLRRSASTGGWSMPEEPEQQQQQYQYQQQQQQQQQLQQHQHQKQQQKQLLKQAEAKTLLDARHRPSSGAWSIRDDKQLIMARSEGLNWSQIQEQFFPSKSSNACRKRHERLIDSKGRGNDETMRVERIAAEYVQMREKLWRPLAEKTGEKWSYVEKTCLSHGLKNLQGVARAATRRQRFDADAMAAAAAAAAAGYDDDSGVSGIGLTPVEEADASAAAAMAAAAYSSSPSGAGAPPSPHDVAQSFASTTTTQATAYLAHPHHLAQAHLHPAAYSTLMYGGAAAAQYHPQHAYSSSISSEGSLHPGYVSRRGNESA